MDESAEARAAQIWESVQDNYGPRGRNSVNFGKWLDPIVAQGSRDFVSGIDGVLAEFAELVRWVDGLADVVPALAPRIDGDMVWIADSALVLRPRKANLVRGSRDSVLAVFADGLAGRAALVDAGARDVWGRTWDAALSATKPTTEPARVVPAGSLSDLPLAVERDTHDRPWTVVVNEEVGAVIARTDAYGVDALVDIAKGMSHD
jgi:hypothetical protein